ncbi:MAG: hypothetical protein V7637_5469, partial [Mycobacteriales bacterium]
MTGAPLKNVRRVKRRGDTLRGLLSALLMFTITAGVPVALVLVVGNPIPTPPDSLQEQVPVEFVLKIVVCIVWLAWAQLVTCMISEFVAGVRGSGLPWRVPFAAAAQQDFARRLVTAVLLLATAGQGLHSAPAPSSASARPAAATASVAGALQQVANAAVGQADAAARQANAALHAQGGSQAGRLHPGGAREYIVMPPQGRHHDSLWDIAERYLGSGIRYREIFELNQGRVQPDGDRLTLESLIRPGWTLLMPKDARGEGLIEVTANQMPAPGQAAPRVEPRSAPPTDARAGTAAHAPAATHAPAAGTAAGSGGLSGSGSLAGSVPLAGSGRLGESPAAPGRVNVPARPAQPAAQAPAPQTGPPSPSQPPSSGGLSRVVLTGPQEQGQPAPAPERAPNIPWDIVGAELLAAGVLEALIAMRRRRARQRMAGAGVALPDAEAAGV